MRGTLHDGLKVTEISSTVEPAPEHGLASETAGAVEGPLYVAPSTDGATLAAPTLASQPGVASHQQRGTHEVVEASQDPQQPSPPSRHSAGGGVCCLMLSAQVHADRWATIAIMAVLVCGWAVAVIRANRPPRPHTPPRGPFASRGDHRAKD